MDKLIFPGHLLLDYFPRVKWNSYILQAHSIWFDSENNFMLLSCRIGPVAWEVLDGNLTKSVR